MNEQGTSVRLDLGHLRRAIQTEYEVVARDPTHGFHFHTGRPLARMLGYGESLLNGIPGAAIESFAGTGNPFKLGKINRGERIVDIGAGAGIDSLIAARMTGPDGHVVGVDMTPTMLDKAREAAKEAGLNNVDFREGHGEALPLPDSWADVAISNGVLNLMPNKSLALEEMARVLKPDGRLQIADILVEKAVPEGAKEDIGLWTG
ncbi:MAG TPA: methyltransferase domain-containing protein [Acidobacteriota bacterium]|nr:methyltransferase domain-containing protein [Acidobacteriota bacterium]